MTVPGLADAPTTNPKLLAWVREVAELTQPDRVEWSDGSQEEWDRLSAELVASGMLTRLNPTKRPNSFLARSHPSDVARVEDRTFICSEREERRRPDQQLARPGRDARDPEGPVRRLDARPHDVRHPVLDGPARLADLAAGRGDHRQRRTSSLNMRIMTRMGKAALDLIGERRRLRAGAALGRRPARAGPGRRRRGRATTTKYIVHFPETREIWSFGSGYGGNALLGKKCFALRIASVMARDEGWLAEHMLILQAHLAGGRGQAPGRCLPLRLRQDQPRDARADRPGLEGRDRRRRHLLDALRPTTAGCTRSTPRRASSVSPPGPARPPTATRSRRSGATASSPTSVSPTTATCGGRASPTRRLPT